MSKYQPFAEFLRSSEEAEKTLSFAEIEAILGFKLPDSKRYNAWWSNNSFNSTMTQVWLDAGWKTRDVKPSCDSREGYVTFYRVVTKYNTDVEVSSDGSTIVDLVDLDEVPLNVLRVIARRNSRTIADEALSILNAELSR